MLPKERGNKPHKTPSLEEHFSAATAHIKME